MRKASCQLAQHPHHPLCGQQVQIVRIRRGADPDLIVQLPDGLHAAKEADEG